MTVKHKDGASSSEVGNLCDIHLLHTGVRKYCEFEELKESVTSGINKIDAEQLLTQFTKKRQLKAQFVPRETRGSEKKKTIVCQHWCDLDTTKTHQTYMPKQPTNQRCQ